MTNQFKRPFNLLAGLHSSQFLQKNTLTTRSTSISNVFKRRYSSARYSSYGVPLVVPFGIGLGVGIFSTLALAKLWRKSDRNKPVKEKTLVREELSSDEMGKSSGEMLNANNFGGYKEQQEQLIREVFNAHALKPYAIAYDIHQPRGVLLYGPPGTGKTTLARGIGQSFGKVTVVNGPELKSALLGKSEKKIRELFADAKEEWKIKGERSQLHVIIIDEIDGGFPKRTSNGSSSTERSENSDVSQLLTMLDGVDSPRNILVIGTTNRMENLDPALLRPGRLEVHVKIDLPNESDRHDILIKKTQYLRNNGLLGDSVDLDALAKKTNNFSGAELEYLVEKAKQLALESNFGSNSESSRVVVDRNIELDVASLQKVNQEHFEKVYTTIKPATINNDTQEVNSEAKPATIESQTSRWRW